MNIHLLGSYNLSNSTQTSKINRTVLIFFSYNKLKKTLDIFQVFSAKTDFIYQINNIFLIFDRVYEENGKERNFWWIYYL